MTLSDMLITIAPELEDDFRAETFLEWAALSVNRRVFGSRADLATVYLAAHMMTRAPISGSPGAAGPVVQEKIGDISASYAHLQMPGFEEFSTTSYGTQYVQLLRAVSVSPLVV